MMFCFRSILQIWIIFHFRDTNDYVDLGICKHEFKFTCRGYCRFTLTSDLMTCVLYQPVCLQMVDRLTTLYNVCSVHRGMFITSGDVQYIEGCSVHQGDIMSTSGGYPEYIGGCSVHRGDIMMNVGIP